MLYKVTKNNGKYFLENEETAIDITEFIEQEIQIRDSANIDLKFYFEENKQKTSDLIEIKARYNTMQKYFIDLIAKSEKVADDWFTRGECYGSALTLRKQINLLKKWIEQTKKSKH